MKELSLFTGAGGGLLGSKLLGWETIAAVEINEYCQKVLKERQVDKILEEFPIYSDIKTFNGNNYRGKVGIVTGGFPCQPFSTASHGIKTAEDLWPEMLRVVKETQAPAVFAENVQEKPINKAADDLESLGYAVKCTKLSGPDIGAPHRRNRYWLLGYSDKGLKSACEKYEKAQELPKLANTVPWTNPPGKLGMVDGMANRLDRTKALGNGQIPRMVVAAFSILNNSFMVDKSSDIS